MAVQTGETAAQAEMSRQVFLRAFSGDEVNTVWWLTKEDGRDIEESSWIVGPS